MATIIPHEGENWDSVLGRLKRKSSKGLSEARSKMFFMTKGQKRRNKSKKARKLARRMNQKLAAERKRQEIYFRKPVVMACDNAWPIPGLDAWYETGDDGERALIRQRRSKVIESANRLGSAGLVNFGEAQRITAVEKTFHTCVITPVMVHQEPCIILVRSFDDNRVPRKRFGVQGGGNEPGETSAEAGRRETREEIGADTDELTDEDIVARFDLDDHVSTCYSGTIIGTVNPGKLTQGDEIFELKIFPVRQIYTRSFLSTMLLPKHKAYLLEYKDFLEKKTNRTPLQDLVLQAILNSENFRPEEVAAHV